MFLKESREKTSFVGLKDNETLHFDAFSFSRLKALFESDVYFRKS